MITPFRIDTSSMWLATSKDYSSGISSRLWCSMVHHYQRNGLPTSIAASRWPATVLLATDRSLLAAFSERERNRLRAQKALASGKTREAEQFFQRAIEITPDMVLSVIRVGTSPSIPPSNVKLFVVVDSSNYGHRHYCCPLWSGCPTGLFKYHSYGWLCHYWRLRSGSVRMPSCSLWWTTLILLASFTSS